MSNKKQKQEKFTKREKKYAFLLNERDNYIRELEKTVLCLKRSLFGLSYLYFSEIDNPEHIKDETKDFKDYKWGIAPRFYTLQDGVS